MSLSRHNEGVTWDTHKPCYEKFQNGWTLATGEENQRLFFISASQRDGSADQYVTLHSSWQASNSLKLITTKFPAAVKVEGLFFEQWLLYWCDMIPQHCSPDPESFLIYCKPFYSPYELLSFIQVGADIPLQANVQNTQCMLAYHLLYVGWTNPEICDPD